MPEKRRRYDPEFRDGAIRIVRETGKSIRQVAEDLGDECRDPGQLGGQGPRCSGECLDPTKVDPERVRELERENAELRMERDVLKRSVVLWVKEATR